MINVAPSPHARYNIKEIKEDALWLSKKTVIDEVAALRITVLEWQTRSIARLLEDGLPERPGNGLQLSVQAGGASNFAWKKSELLGAEDPAKERRLRLLEIVLSERCYLLKTSEYILSRHVCIKSTPAHSRENGLLNEIGAAILSKWNVEGSQKRGGKQKGFLSSTVSALDGRIRAISEGCMWLEPEAHPERLQVAWAHNLSSEIIHILQITLSILEVREAVLLSEPVVEWFAFMNEVHFCEGFSNPGEDGQHDLVMQSLAVLVSLALLDISKTLDLLENTSTALMPAAESTDSLPYFLKPRTVMTLHEIFVDHARLRVASPVTLAWSIIAQTIREIAVGSRESKETRQSLRAADCYNGADSSDTDSTPRYPSRGINSSLRRRSSTGSDTSLQPLLIEEVYEATTLAAVDGDSITHLAMHAIRNENAFDVVATIASEFCTPFGSEHAGRPGQKMRNMLLELMRSCIDFIQYQPALIDTTMCILTGKERFWDLLDRQVFAYDDQPSTQFIRDPALRQKLLLVAASRFPYESIPFLEFCRALAFQYTSSDGTESTPWANLEELDTFTCRLPLGFESTEPIREEEEGDFIRLTDTLGVLIGSEETDLLSRAVQHRGLPPPSYARHDLTMAQVVIPVGTTGVVQSETKPFVVGWNHQYPGLAYMGKLLQRASATGSSVESHNGFNSPLVVAEVIRLISTLLVSAIKSPCAERDLLSSAESAQSILRQASDELDRNQDIISVILQILDNELHNPQQDASGEPFLDILIESIQFTNVLTLLFPDRVWPFLGRSGLLKIDQEESQLSWVTSLEMATGQYRFLLGCVRLFENLITDTLSHVTSRNAPTKSVTRFGAAESLGSGVSQVTMQSVLLSFTRSMIDVFESAPSWRFMVPADRMEINMRLCSAFDKIVTYHYGVGDGSDPPRHLTSSFSPAAKYILDAFLSVSNNDFVMKPLVDIFAIGMRSRTTTLPSLRDQYQFQQTIAALKLTSTLSRINTSLHQPPPYLEESLFKATPILIRVYVAHESYRLPVVDLLNALVSASAASDRQPRSLLGHLGHDDADSFLDVLSQLDSPIDSSPLSIAIWNLFSAVVDKRQQWFAIYILTGVAPRETLKNRKESETSSGEPILNTALNLLSNISKQESSKALAMLKFLVASANNWPWVFPTIHQHPDFMKAISEFEAQSTSTGDAIDDRPDYDRSQMTSYVSKILAMHTYFAQQSGDQKSARSLVPHLNYLINNAISVPTYNKSLHSNLRNNLEAKFLGCSLSDFERARWREGALGESFYYDIDFASLVFSYDAAWIGKKGHGFMEEFKRANANLSLVEAQIVSQHFIPQF